MKKIIYIPLDERPCNDTYPQHLVNTRDDVQLVTPSKQILGNKKEAADVEKVWDFVFANADKADGFVLSSEMLLYGGLLPSRLHHLTEEDSKERVEKFRQLREKNKKAPMYVSTLIMRTPKFSTADEEPDYYAYYGRELFRRAYLRDKKQRVGLEDQEEHELAQLNTTIPSPYIEDYESRRAFNLHINLQMLKLAKEEVIDFLSIPQDDSSIFGYTARDQEAVYRRIAEKGLQRKVLVYPGADEVGCTLIARMLNRLLNRRPSIYYFYSSTNAPHIVPLYEDRPMNESVKAHIFASGCQITTLPQDADFILAINAPGQFMEEAADQAVKDVTYSSYRQLGFFADHIHDWIQADKPLVIADSAFANGGDQELISFLDDYQVLGQLVSYKGWNTNGNTLGTTIAAGVFGFEKQNLLELQKNLLYHILDDVFYQSQIRKDITKTLLPDLNADYFDLNQQDDTVEEEIKQQMLKEYQAKIKKSFQSIMITEWNVFSPWSRMFEVGMELQITSK